MNILIEPETLYRARRSLAYKIQVIRAPLAGLVEKHSSMPSQIRKPLASEFWVDLILETVRESAEAPRITTVVNAVVRQGNFRSRSGREAQKCELFKIVGVLIKSRRLKRVARKYVTIPIPGDEYLPVVGKKFPELARLPEPNL